ncbi:MAG: DUF1972 domain-containing protein [Flavobacteriales bacterium]|nr:DUF1972 domain-containing protein [Flavobacteriales bacterium]
MRIAILGTRGIPNNYGGFEQFAEFLSQHLVEEHHEVYVYNSSEHPYKEETWKGVNLIAKNDPEHKMGTVGQFIYDLNCILDARNRNFDIILQLGYTSSSIWHWLMPKKSIVITNMDGLEWKRSKFSKPVQRFLKYAEKLAVNNSDFLISDSIGIQESLYERYKKQSKYIPYGASIPQSINEQYLEKYKLVKYQYNMLIARIEPENSIETILDGVLLSKSPEQFIVIGKTNNTFGQYLVNKFKEVDKIVFLDGIYDMEALNCLRFYSNLYFHGHSVGGTNPSLLEAMSSSSLIIAHNNNFNKYILEQDGYYFSDVAEVTSYLDGLNKEDHPDKVENSLSKIKTKYSWNSINSEYTNYFIECLD